MPQITAGEIAARHGVSRRDLMRLVEAGKVPFSFKLPGATGAYVFDSEEVAAAFEQIERDKPSQECA